MIPKSCPISTQKRFWIKTYQFFFSFFSHQTSVLKTSSAMSIFVIVESSPPVLFMNESSAFFEWISVHEWTDSHSTTPPPPPSERPGSLGKRGGWRRNFIDFMRMLHPGCTINGCGGWIDGERLNACGDESSQENPPLLNSIPVYLNGGGMYAHV